MTPGSWQAASACETLLWWSCRSRIGLTRRGGRVRVCPWLTDWTGQGKSIHPEALRPACNDEITWPFGRTLRTSYSWGKRRSYRLFKTVSLGVLACRGRHRSRRYRRLWPRRGRLRLLASFRQSSWWFFQRGGLTARNSYAWDENQTAHSAADRARLLRLRS